MSLPTLVNRLLLLPRTVIVAVALVALSACGGGTGSAPRPAQAAPEPAEFQQGDLHIRASAIPTMQLADSVARGYGITRGDDRILLLVAVRRGAEAHEVSVPARVEGWVTDLRGRRQVLSMRELRTGELVDHVADIQTSLPDTLQFQIMVTPRGEASRRLDFVREFHPR